MSDSVSRERVLSGMRVTGRLHLGHYHGVLKNWVMLQEKCDSFYFVADWHALTTHYEEPGVMERNVWEMVIDWLASGVDPTKATLFIQSRIPQHAELHLLLSMVTPLGWLERVPSFKDQQQKIKGRDLATYGFLGYPVLQSADILIYRASQVPVGEDQVPHIELTREIARRFNRVFGKDAIFEEKAEQALVKLGKKAADQFRRARRAWLQEGNADALAQMNVLIDKAAGLGDEERERLRGYSEGGGRSILPEPQALLTPASKYPGIDGQKMSKSYDNQINMRDDPDRVAKALRTMPTDPARQRRNDPGDPDKCPVWGLHKVYTDSALQQKLAEGCRSAAIGCLDCKKPLIEVMLEEQAQLRARAKPYEDDPGEVRRTIDAGCERAMAVAEETMQEVRDVVGTVYR
ncbi:MAG: tryptophan--tRNA ligase [Acidiferrobacteraceae bacterium]|nr:tryptophan--tRNA ligase [Acidiferrobacteraceae bacterium]